MTQDAPQEKTQRLFVAIEVPDAVRQLLAEQQKGLSGVRWTSPENLHLTVRFIGEAASAQASAIKTGLRSAFRSWSQVSAFSTKGRRPLSGRGLRSRRVWRNYGGR